MFACTEYKLLDEDMQMQLAWLDGVFLMERKTEKVKAVLFYLYGFYVEMFFADEEPLFVKAFEELWRLDPYLQLIDITEIFERSE